MNPDPIGGYRNLQRIVLAILAAMRGDAAGLRADVDATLANARAFGHFHHAQYDIG